MRTQRRGRANHRRRHRSTRKGGAFMDYFRSSKVDFDTITDPRQRLAILGDFQKMKMYKINPSNLSMPEDEVYQRTLTDLDRYNRGLRPMAYGTERALGSAGRVGYKYGKQGLGAAGRGLYNVGKYGAMGLGALGAAATAAAAAPVYGSYKASQYGYQKGSQAYGRYQDRARTQKMMDCEKLLVSNGYEVTPPPPSVSPSLSRTDSMSSESSDYLVPEGIEETVNPMQLVPVGGKRRRTKRRRHHRRQ